MRQFLMQRLRNKDLWAGFVIGIVLTVSLAYSVSSELAKVAIEGVLEILLNP